MSGSQLLLDWISLDRDSDIPIYRQLYFNLRTAILDNRLPGGSILPPSRTLAKDLKVSRNTVLNAYDQMAAEGYLETSGGSSTTVALLSSGSKYNAPYQGEPEFADTPHVLSKWGEKINEISWPMDELPEATAFKPGAPAFDSFPVKKWNGLLTAQAGRMKPDIADTEAHPGGYSPLRDTLASYLRSARMVDCDADQIIITSSARAALDIIVRLMADSGTSCLMEEPGYLTAGVIIRAAGLKTVPVPVDSDGLRIDLGERIAPDARLAFVTPSHQWPTGVSLSASRRKQLLDWASRRNAWVIEDDYDSEFRFTSRPLATLQGLDGGQRVFYIGTFSKVMFPSLRTAYVVVPKFLIPVFRDAVFCAGQEPPLFLQAALDEFFKQGFYFTHVRRMRRVYKQRQAALVDALARHLGDKLPVVPPAGGMQLVLMLPDEIPAANVSANAARSGLHVRTLEMYAQTNKAPNALHLGFASIPESQIEPAVRRLAAAIFTTR